MKRRDKRRKRDRRKAKKEARQPEPAQDMTGHVARVVKDSAGRRYIQAPDGSVRRADKVNPDKLFWLSEPKEG